MHIPPWLDDERKEAAEVYAEVIHRACVCAWEPTYEDPDNPRWRLVMRKRQCVIHGLKGHV